MSSPTIDETTISRIALPTDARYEILCKMHESDICCFGGNDWISNTAASFLIFYGQGVHNTVPTHTGLYVFPPYVNQTLQVKNEQWRKLQELKGARDEGSDNTKRVRLTKIKSLS